MYGQSKFAQSPWYANVSPYLPNYPPPYTENWCYPVGQDSVQSSETGHEDTVVVASRKREENREIVGEFVRKFEETPRADERLASVERGTLKISEARDKLRDAFGMIESLERLSDESRRNKETLSDEEWALKRQECTVVREKLARLVDSLTNVEGERMIGNLEKLVNQRKKKRRREARKRARLRAEKALAMEKRARRHAKADAWIRDKRDTIERDKQVERLHKDADIVLSDVRGKRNDARKFLALLRELRNLRRVKVNIARARGENLPLAADQAFDSIIGQLVEQWSCLDREYSIEEQGLKLMLKMDNEEKIEKQKRGTFDDWERALFGIKLQNSGSTRLDYILMIRHAWDKYANFEGHGSRVPIGWIMPVPPSSAAWQKSLKREQTLVHKDTEEIKK